MPIPRPKSNESQSEFMSRCILAIKDEYGSDQAIAICYEQWRGDE